jgi:hypothetical protein
MDHIWISHRATSHEMDENELRYVDYGAKKFQEKPSLTLPPRQSCALATQYAPTKEQVVLLNKSPIKS